MIGALVSALTGSSPLAIAVWAGATGLSGAAAVAFSAAQQGREKHRLTQAAGFVFSAARGRGAARRHRSRGRAGSVSVCRPSSGSSSAPSSSASRPPCWCVSLILAIARLGQIRRVRLTSGGALVRGISGAFFALDIGLARDIVVARRAMEIGHVRPQRGRGTGLQAIVWREWQRLRRFPQPLLLVAGSVVVPYAADALGMSTLTPVLAGADAVRRDHRHARAACGC